MADTYNGRSAFFANYGTMTMTVASYQGANINPSQPTATVEVAALKGISIIPKFEHVTLYGMERVTRAAVAKHSLNVDVSVEVAMWNPDSDHILKGVLLGRYDPASPVTRANINDPKWKNKVARFDITMEMLETDALRKVVLVASDVYFESVPYEMKENEFISRNLSGTGKSVYVTTYKRTTTNDSWVKV